MVSNQKIQEVVTYVLDERKKNDGSSMLALMRRAARRAGIKFHDNGEVFKRVGRELNKRADVAGSTPR